MKSSHFDAVIQELDAIVNSDGAQKTFIERLNELVYQSDALMSETQAKIFPLKYHPEDEAGPETARILDSSDTTGLQALCMQGDIMTRAIACIRLLHLPQSAFSLNEDSQTIWQTARIRLSHLLVAHPVLMHPRIFIRSAPGAKSECGPLSVVAAMSKRMELPRSSHGFSNDQMASFARHPCVVAGLTKAAPLSDAVANPIFQGKSFLSAVSPAYLVPRIHLITSLLELDEHRGRGLPPYRRPASFLTARGSTESAVQTMVACSFLAAIDSLGTGLPRRAQNPNQGDLFDAPQASSPASSSICEDFFSAVVRSGLAQQEWLAFRIEANLYRWASISSDAAYHLILNLGRKAIDLNLRLPWSCEESVTAPDAMRWLVHCLLDRSQERCTKIGIPLKNFPIVSTEKISAVIDALEDLAPEIIDTEQSPSGYADMCIELARGAGADWNAVITERAMRRRIDLANQTIDKAPTDVLQRTTDVSFAPHHRSLSL